MPLTLGGGSAGGASAGATIGAGASGTPFDIDLSAVLEGHLQVTATAGTVATTNGLQVQIFARVGSTPVNDTIQQGPSVTIPMATGVTTVYTVKLSTGRYHVVLKNLDAGNALTAVAATLDTFSN